MGKFQFVVSFKTTIVGADDHIGPYKQIHKHYLIPKWGKPPG